MVVAVEKIIIITIHTIINYYLLSPITRQLTLQFPNQFLLARSLTQMAPSFNNGNSLFDFVVRDGNGVKGLADLGLSAVPDRYIQPAEERIEKQKAISGHMLAEPIDLSTLDGPSHEQVVEGIAGAAEALGFFQVVNHGVPVELLESLKDAAHKFFCQTPEKKAIYRGPLVKYGTSFVPEKEKALEWKDYISMAYTSDADALQYWPMECK